MTPPPGAEALFGPPMARAGVGLSLLQAGDAAGLQAAADDPDLWRWFPDRGDGAHWPALWEKMRAKMEAGVWALYVVRWRGDVVGTTGFLAIEPAQRRVEIGHTFYARSAQGGAVNPACKLLMLERAFAWGAERVELKTDALNARSRAAILRLGAVEEGALRHHQKRWDGTFRDSVYFSVLAHEWPAVRAGLEARLAAFGA